MNMDVSAASDGAALFDQAHKLPSLHKRWTARWKAAVIEAVREGRASLDEVCRLYSLSVDEFLAWERDLDPAWARSGTRSIAARKSSRRELTMSLVRTMNEDLAFRCLRAMESR